MIPLGDCSRLDYWLVGSRTCTEGISVCLVEIIQAMLNRLALMFILFISYPLGQN